MSMDELKIESSETEMDKLAEKLLRLKLTEESSMRDLKSTIREVGAFTSTPSAPITQDEKLKLWGSFVSSIESQLRAINSSSPSEDDTANSLIFIKALAEMQFSPLFACNPSKQQQLSVNSDNITLSSDELYQYLLEPILPTFFDFIINNLRQHCESPDLLKSATSLHHVIGLIHKTVRTSLSLLKRISALDNRSLTGNTTEINNLIREKIINYGEILCNLLQNPSLECELDVKCSTGLALCLVIKILRGLPFYSSFFENIFSLGQGATLEVGPLERKTLEISLHTVNRIALAFGVLGISGSNDFCGSMNLFKAIGENVLNIEHGTKVSVSLGSARILESWTQKLVEMDPNIYLDYVNLFHEVEFFVFNNLAGHIDAVKSCCRNIIAKLAKIYEKMEDTCNSPIVFKDYVERFFCKPPHVKWTGISWIARSSPKALCLLEIQSDLPEVLLHNERLFKNASNETYVSLMTNHFEVISTDKWIRTWIEPLFASHKCLNNESNWTQKRTIMSIILKNSNTNLSSAVLHYVITQINNKSLSCAEATQLAVQAVKIATEVEIKLDLSYVQTCMPDSFKGIIPRNLLNSWLWSGNPQARLAAFSLIVDTKKTSEPISSYDFESLKIFFHYNMVSQDPAFRQQFVSHFKKLLKRLNDSLIYVKRKKDTSREQNYYIFLKWLWKAFTIEEGLFAGANFGRRLLTLECLEELSKLFDLNLFGVDGDTDNLHFLRWMNDSYENNKITAFRILEKIPMPIMEDPTFVESLMLHALTQCSSVKPPESVTGRYLVVFILKKASKIYSPLTILTRLYDKLQAISERIEATNLSTVSSEIAVYGYISCIRMIFNETSDYLVDTENYREFSKKLIVICFKLNQTFFPLLGCAAPEGTLIDKPTENEALIVRSINAQRMLVCSWRSMRDACLLMTEMCALVPLEGEKEKFVLSHEQVEAVGNHLLFLLMNLMHRGVFEQIFVGFKLLATRLYTSTTRDLNKLIDKWLENVMDEDLMNLKCTTRRSAGLPFILQALLAPGSSNEPFIGKHVNNLFSKDAHSSPQVRIHIMNVLRALFRDASFSRVIMSYVPCGMKLAFKAQASNYWPEQNSGLMLLGSVVRRIFGPQLNSMSASTFFRKFPEMFEFLLGEVQNCSKKLKDNARLGGYFSDFTFYVLVLLSSFATRGVVEDAHFPLSRFISCIRDCGVSCDVRVRKVASKALVRFLIDPANQFKTINLILQDLKNHNQTPHKVHGDLCAILEILRVIPKDVDLTDIINIFESLVECGRFWHHCPLIFETMAEICLEIGLKAKVSFQLIYEEFQRSFGSFTNRQNVIDLPNTDRKLYEVKVYFSLTDPENDSTELAYTWLTSKNPVFIEQLLSYLCANIHVVFEDSDSSVILNVLVKKYVQISFNFEGQSKLEEKFLDLLCGISSTVYIDWLHYVLDPTELHLVPALAEKVLRLCEMESGSMVCKSRSIELLGKLFFKIQTNLSDDHRERFCHVVSILSDSKSYDEIRYGAAKCLPVISDVDYFKSFTVKQQCKLWYTVIMLAQDDESFIRDEINSKHDSVHGTCCDIKLIENLVELFFNNFVINHNREGLTLITGIILRDDYITAEEADDTEEERLFDKSEINSFNEPLHMAKIVREYLHRNSTQLSEFKSIFHSAKLSSDLIELYEFVSNFIVSKHETELTLHTICQSQIIRKKKTTNDLLYFAQSDKNSFQNTLREYFVNIFS